MEKVLVIVGPTASGKSDFAVQVGKKLDGEVISADSRQVYKGLDIGTGKITKSEMRGIPHYLIDVAKPEEKFTVADYKPMALNAIKFILSRNKLPIIVGGTGFYIDSLSMSLPEVPPDKKFRERLSKKSAEKLYKMLGRTKIDKHNKVRLIRALEIKKALGRIPKIKRNSDYDFIYIGLKPKDLDKRIRQRLLKRVPGIIREARKLKPKRAHELGLEYRFASLYLQGKLGKKEFVEKLNIAIRQYARRQLTWFKRNKKIKWVNPDSASFGAAMRKLEGSLKRERQR